MVSKKCLNCQNELLGKQLKFCSDTCRKNKNKDKIKEQKKRYYQRNKIKILDNVKEYDKANKEKMDTYRMQYRINNSEKNIKYQKEYRKKKGDILLEQKKEYYEKNKSQILNTKKIYKRKRRKEDPMYRLGHNFSSNMMGALKRYAKKGLSKRGRHWEDIVGYTIVDLKEHLENLFQEGMTWDNYGKWHVDHIVPVSFFHPSSLEDDDFRNCWDLSNLQPLWAADNIRKGNTLPKIRIEGSNHGEE